VSTVALLGLIVFAGCGSRRPDVVLLVIDTLRADHLHVYGYSKPTSPHIDALARRATVFENAIAQAPHTIPSVLQIMTSRYVPSWTIRREDATLAETLRNAGYQTAAVVENANFETDRNAHGLLRGFDRFYRNGVIHRDSTEQQHWKMGTAGDTITAQAVRWWRGRDRSRPAFLWAHYFDPHDPYMPPFADDMEELSWGAHSRFPGDIRRTFLYRGEKGERLPFTDADRQHLIDLYDAEIRYADQAIGELLAFLDTQGDLDDALIILTADHGESFGEHDLWTHGYSLYEPEIHVPMIVKFPRQRQGERVALPAQTIDLFPTVLDVLGLPAGALRLEGTSLRQRTPRLAFAFHGAWSTVRGESWKLVQRGETTQLFQLATDPGERHDVAAANAPVVHELRAARERTLATIGLGAGEMERTSDETVDRLRALGYVQ
jgi:arylsulfatase